MSDAEPFPVRIPTKRYEARRNAMIAAAVESLNQRGVRGMTLSDVTARLNRVPTGVIYYFKNKEELAAAAFMKAIARFDQLVAASEAHPLVRDRIEGLVRDYFAFCHDVTTGNAEPIVVFNDVRALNMPSVNEAYVAMFRRTRRLISCDHDLPREHLNARTHLLLSQLFWIPAWLGNWQPEDYSRVADRVTRILLDGIAASRGIWPNVARLNLETGADAKASPSSELYLRAATQLINDEGYHGASVERIAAKLNVSKGAFYHHNETKDQLVVACFQRTVDLLWLAVREAEAHRGSGLQTLVAITSALLEHQMVGDAPLLRTSALTTVPESIRAGLIDKLARITFRISSIVCDGMADGSVRPVDASVAAEMITAAVNAAAELHFWVPGIGAATVTDYYLKPLFTGMGNVRSGR